MSGEQRVWENATVDDSGNVVMTGTLTIKNADGTAVFTSGSTTVVFTGTVDADGFVATNHGVTVPTGEGIDAPSGDLQIGAEATSLNIGGTAATLIGFYGVTNTAQQTGVAVSAAAIHAALVNLGLITA